MHPIYFQDDEKDIDNVLFTELAGILFASGKKLQRLSVFPQFTLSYAYLPCKLISTISAAAALQSLTMILPESRNIRTLAESVGSLQKLKVLSFALRLLYMRAVKDEPSVAGAGCKCFEPCLPDVCSNHYTGHS